MSRVWLFAVLAGLLLALLAPPAVATGREPVPVPQVEGPIPGQPFFSTTDDLAGNGYVEEEFLLSGVADAYETSGVRVAEDVPYRTRIVVRRPVRQRDFNGTVLMEWQNVTAGYDLDALWNGDHVMRSGYAWVGVSAQRVGVDQLAAWNPERYGDLDVTGGRTYLTDQLSYDVFAQAAQAVRRRGSDHPLGRLRPRTVLAIGASQSAGRMTVYYDVVLPQVEPVFDGYAHIVGSAPTRVGEEPVFQVLSETDVRSPARPADTGQFRRWEVAGAAHSGWRGQEYRRPLQLRDLGEVPEYTCDQPPWSRIPLHHVVAAAFDHLERWTERGTPPPTAPPLEFGPDGQLARDADGHALGGIRLSQLEVPTALNTGTNSGQSFCRLFGTHIPYDEAALDARYPSRARYVGAVVATDLRNLRRGYLLHEDARQNLRDALTSGVGG